MFFTESQPIICSMKGVSIRNLGKMFQGCTSSNMPTLNCGSTDLLQAKFAWKANHILVQHQGRNSATWGEARAQVWRGEGGGTFDSEARSAILGKSWVAPIEAGKEGEMQEPEHLLHPMWNPPPRSEWVSGAKNPQEQGVGSSEFLQQICSDVGPSKQVVITSSQAFTMIHFRIIWHFVLKGFCLFSGAGAVWLLPGMES